MPHTFDAAVTSAILHHMNVDHADDSLLIARAFAAPGGREVEGAVMVGLDGDAGVWEIVRGDDVSELRVAWPDGPIDERSAVRREIVALYHAACIRLGVESRGTAGG